MSIEVTRSGRSALALVVGATLALTGCGGESATSNAPAPASNSAAGAAVPAVLVATDATWTPEELEDLLAPVALYGDSVLGNIFVAATNPQEVLDAGNWRLQNEILEGPELDAAAKRLGLTGPVRVLVQHPSVLDMMSSELGWTTEVGQAYLNDQAGVLGAVQRLRVQAKDAGNLVSSDKLEVTTEEVDGEQYVYVSSPDPEVVYVPQYDPEVVYAPVEQDSGNSTGTAVAAAVIGFGAGLVVSNLFQDDDDDWYEDDYYYPNYYGGPSPYYAHYPYSPGYGGSYRASTAYNRPANYRYSYTNTTVNVRRSANDNYWNRYDDRSYTKHNANDRRGPITKANPKRNDLDRINEQARTRPKQRAPEGSYGKGREGGGGGKARDGDRAGGGQGIDVDRAGGDRPGDRAGGGGGGGANRDNAKGGGDRGNAGARADQGGRGGGGGGGGANKGARGGGGGGGGGQKAGGGGGGGGKPKGGGGGGGKPKGGGGGGGGGRGGRG